MRHHHHLEVMAWLEQQGATDVRIDWGNARSHPKVRFSFGGRELWSPLCNSPSDTNATKVAISVLRHAMGIVNAPRTRVADKRRKRA